MWKKLFLEIRIAFVTKITEPVEYLSCVFQAHILSQITINIMKVLNWQFREIMGIKFSNIATQGNYLTSF